MSWGYRVEQKRIEAALGPKKSLRIYEILQLFIGCVPRRVSIDNDTINHTQIAHVCIINMHLSAGFDRGLDHFAVLVQDVTAPVKDVGAWTIGTILENN